MLTAHPKQTRSARISVSTPTDINANGGGARTDFFHAALLVKPIPGGGGDTQFRHGRSRMTMNPRIPIMPGRSTSGFRQNRQTLLAPSAKRREVFGESHEG